MRPRKRRRINPSRVKIHRSYTIDEAARCCDVHRGSVRRWIASGLPLCDDRRPYLIRGRDLRDFLQSRRVKAKQPCAPGQIYCVGCRAPVFPTDGMADYVPKTDITGDLVGLCPDCECLIHRRVNIAKLYLVMGDLDVAIPKGHSRITDTADLPLNVHLVT